MIIPVLGIIGMFFLPIVMVILIVWFQSNEKRMRYKLQAELATKALEKGQPIPSELFAEPIKKRNPLNTGIICISVGIGIALFIWLAGGAIPGADLGQAASIGVIPFLIGVAYVVIHFIEKKKATAENAK